MGTEIQKSLAVIALFLTAFAVITGASATPTVISVESAENVQNGSTVLINVTAEQITDPDGIGSYTFNLTFDPNVLNVLNVQEVTSFNINNDSGWVKFNEFFFNPVTENGTILAKLQLIALKNDGSSSPLNLTIESLYDPGANSIPAVAVNGTFTTLDEVSPVITFDVSENQIMGNPIKLNATISDAPNKVNATSIAVKIDGTTLSSSYYTLTPETDNETVNVFISADITQLGYSLPSTIMLIVEASDIAGNSNYSSVNLSVSETGFTPVFPDSGSYINSTTVEIEAQYVNMNNATIGMYLTYPDGTTVLVASNPSGTSGMISYTATGLTDGNYSVLVNGTDLWGNSKSSSWWFVVDTIKPTISIEVEEAPAGDGDGFAERNEAVTLNWSVSDENIERVEIWSPEGALLTSLQPSGTQILSFDDYGDFRIVAVDKAGNQNETIFHIYNNYVVYVLRAEPKEVFGINITKMGSLDIIDPEIVSYEFPGASGVSLPLESAQRIISPGVKANFTVVIDNTANKTIGSFPSTAVIFDENSMLDFYIEAPAKGMIMALKLNNTKAKDIGTDLIQNLSLKGITLEELPDLMEYAYIFNESGWGKVKYNANTKQFSPVLGEGTGTIQLSGNISQLINSNRVDISNGFQLSSYFDDRPVLKKGYYALLVIDLDSDITALDLVAPFVALNGTLNENSPSISSQVMVGEKLTLNFNNTFNVASVLIVKNVDYEAYVEVDLTEKLLNILNASLSYGDRPLKEVKLFNKSTNIWLPEGMVSWAFTTKDSSSIEIDTSGLETGDYLVYSVALDSEYMPLFVGSTSVELTADSEPPSIELELVNANSTAIEIHYSFEDNDLLEAVLIKAIYPNATSDELLNLANVNKESLSGNVIVDVSSLAEGESVTVYAEASDRSGNSNSLSISYTKPVIANVNETETAAPAPDLEVKITAGANNTVVSLGAVKGKTAKELGVPKEVTDKKPEFKPVKAIKVEAKVLNGSVKEWTLRVEYTDSEISGLDESSLTIFYWNGSDWIDLRELWETRTTTPVSVDATHNMTSYLHDLANNFIEVKMDNLSVFSLAAKPAPAAVPPAVEDGFRGYAAPTARAYSTPLMTVEGGREVTVTLPSNAFLLTQVASLKLTPGKTVQLQTIVEKLEKLPYGIPRPAGDVILLLKIELIPSEETVVSGSITFAVERDAISERGIDPDEAIVTLLKYTGTSWIELPTEFVKSDGKYNYYRAETPSFSYFAAVVEAPAPITPTPTAPPETPTPPVSPTPPVEERAPWLWIGLGIVIVIVIIAAALYLRRR